jgi:glycogen operon protein
VTDSLRYWVEEMHVDGFRFDLAVTLGREPDDFNPRAAFFKTIQQDPVLSKVRLIAEPWDLGWGGFQVGNFPVGWGELNGRFRDCVRRFWMGDGRVLGEFAARITGSEDLFLRTGRSPAASVNFITSHDGFTLRDLVSYAGKHNEANGENNRDGEAHNLSENHGVEGPVDDREILEIRARQCRNFFATLILSQGVPLILAGDEIGRTQQGNNNAYCQDNEISWLDWDRATRFEDLRRFVKELIRFRRRHPVLRKRFFFSGRNIHGSSVSDMAWFTPEGRPVDDKFWNTERPGTFSVVINRNSADLRHNGWRKHESDSLMILFNASDRLVDFVLPGGGGVVWECRIDTGERGGFMEPGERVGSPRGAVALKGRSLQVWRLKSGEFVRNQECLEEPEACGKPVGKTGGDR